MKTTSSLWLAIIATLFPACTRQISDGDASGGAGSATRGDTSTTDGPGASETGATGEEGSTTGDATATTAPPIVCEEGWTACEDDECTPLGSDASNCGECGHSCKGWGTTARCIDWKCEPGLWPCIQPHQGIETCAEACASVGQTCATDAYCSDHVRVWLTVSGNDNNPEATIETCEQLSGSSTSFTQSCDAPIDWDYVISGRTVLGVACCCTQD